MNQHYRQGDVLVEQVESIPEAATSIERDGDRVILAYGEVTGHAHAIKNRIAKFYQADGERFLDLSKACELEHEEHSTILLPAGRYRVVIQREYSPAGIRNVAD